MGGEGPKNDDIDRGCNPIRRGSLWSPNPLLHVVLPVLSSGCNTCDAVLLLLLCCSFRALPLLLRPPMNGKQEGSQHVLVLCVCCFGLGG